MNLSRNIKFLLQLRGWSGAELARRAKVPKQFITDILSGRSPRQLANLKRVADALEVTGGIDALVFSDLCVESTLKLKEKDLASLIFDDEAQSIYRGKFEIVLKRIKD